MSEQTSPELASEELDSRQKQVYAWRLEGFTSLGLSEVDAMRLAYGNADLHKAESLKRAGCSLSLLVEILA